MDPRKVAEAKAQEMYDNVEWWIKEDIEHAIVWAKKTLTDREGSGHQILVTSAAPISPKLVMCHFAKPEWSGDHCGSPMETASEAIVMSVCEYLCGC